MATVEGRELLLTEISRGDRVEHTEVGIVKSGDRRGEHLDDGKVPDSRRAHLEIGELESMLHSSPLGDVLFFASKSASLCKPSLPSLLLFIHHLVVGGGAGGGGGGCGSQWCLLLFVVVLSGIRSR